MTSRSSQSRSARFDDTVANTPFDTAVEVQMAAMLLFLPLAFGGTLWWCREVWFALVGGMGLSVMGKLTAYRGARAVWTWAYVPIVLFLSLVLLQAVRLPAGLVKILSPGAMATRQELLADLPNALGGSQTVSLYAHATWQQLTWVLAVVLVFVVVLHVYHAPVRVHRLLVTMTLAGLAVGAVATYQDLTDATLIYGSVPIGHHNAGPFQNYSHFSQFMNLSVGAGLALILWTLTDWAADDPDPAAIVRRLSRSDAWPVWAAAVLCVGGPVLVLWSRSRMGMLSLLVAGALTAAALGVRAGKAEVAHVSRRRRRRSRSRPGGGYAFLVAGLGVAVLAVVLAVGFDVVYDRLATLRNAEQTSVARLQILKDLTVLYRKFPVLGTGLGTHEWVFPGYDHRNSAQIATHAEDEYAQLMEECGGVGAAIAFAFVAVIAVAYWRATARPGTPTQFAVFGLGFGLFAILIHSTSDFGQHVPSDATLTAVCCALVINAAASLREARAEPSVWQRVTGGRRVREVALAALAVGIGWLIWRADRERRAEAAYFDAKAAAAFVAAVPDATDDDYRALLTSAAAASAAEPADVLYAHWLNVYRWEVIARSADPRSGPLRLSDAAVGFAGQLVDALDAVRQLCPTFGPPLGLAGQIRAVVLNDPAGETQIQTAYRLTPYDATLCRTAGESAARRGNMEAAVAAFKRYIALGGDRRGVVAAFAAAGSPQLAYEFAGDDRAAIDELAARTTDPRWAAFCRAQSAHLLRIAATQPDAGPDVLMARGRLEAQNGRPADAAAWYEQALTADYGQADWRMELAKARAANGQFSEAVRQTSICLRLRPHWPEAEQLELAWAGRSDDRPTASQPSTATQPATSAQ